jgi:hypothetical protein
LASVLGAPVPAPAAAVLGPLAQAARPALLVAAGLLLPEHAPGGTSEASKAAKAAWGFTKMQLRDAASEYNSTV